MPDTTSRFSAFLAAAPSGMNDYDSDAVGGGLVLGAVGAYRYSSTRWFEIGIDAAIRDLNAKQTAIASSLSGAIRFRTTGPDAFLFDLSAGPMRLDLASGNPRTWPRWLAALQPSVGAIASNRVAFKVALTIAGGGGGNEGSSAYGGSAFYGALELQIGGRIDL